MNKERSEEIKRLVNSIEEIYYNPRKREASTELIERFYGACHIDYLIDQAERYEECKRDAIELHKQNKRYREAIEKAIEMISESTGTITTPKEMSLYDAWILKSMLLETILEGEE